MAVLVALAEDGGPVVTVIMPPPVANEVVRRSVVDALDHLAITKRGKPAG